MGVKVLGVAPASGSSAGGGLFGHGSGPELALTTEVSGAEVLLLAPSVTAGATGASDPVRSSPSGLGRPAVASRLFHPLGSQPGAQRPAVGGGGG